MPVSGKPLEGPRGCRGGTVFCRRWPMPLMTGADFTAVAAGFRAAGLIPALCISAADSEGSMPHFGGVTAIPTTITPITATTPITGITATIQAPAITATIRTMATARTPTPGRPGIIAPTPPATIPMWHSARLGGSRFRQAGGFRTESSLGRRCGDLNRARQPSFGRLDRPVGLPQAGERLLRRPALLDTIRQQ